jgi:hypothetical protein
MLACKRGHTNVVDVLVSNGAEIYVRDNRGRSALDTTMRRNHVDLIPFLSTQYQVRKMQEASGRERMAIFKKMRSAYNSVPCLLRIAPDVLRDVPIADSLLQDSSSMSSSVNLDNSPECRDQLRPIRLQDHRWPLLLMRYLCI